MSSDRRYPAAVTDEFPRPPASFVDSEDRTIQVRRLGNGPPAVADEREAVAGMYEAFDPADRAQGIPPVERSAIDSWLDTVLNGECVNVLAWHDTSVVGHGMLVPDQDEASELAIFVLQAYQNAGIGSRLIRCLLGAGRAAGLERVWLTVERWNGAAISLYKDVGFETVGTESFELEMALRLAD